MAVLGVIGEGAVSIFTRNERKALWGEAFGKINWNSTGTVSARELFLSLHDLNMYYGHDVRREVFREYNETVVGSELLPTTWDELGTKDAYRINMITFLRAYNEIRYNYGCPQSHWVTAECIKGIYAAESDFSKVDYILYSMARFFEEQRGMEIHVDDFFMLFDELNQLAQYDIRENILDTFNESMPSHLTLPKVWERRREKEWCVINGPSLAFAIDSFREGYGYSDRPRWIYDTVPKFMNHHSHLTANLSEKSFPDLVRIDRTYGGLCELVCNQIILDSIPIEHLDTRMLKSRITLKTLNQERVRKSHIWDVHTQFAKACAWAFRFYPDNIFSYFEQFKLIKDFKINRGLLLEKLEGFEENIVLKVVLFNKTTNNGHSVLIKKWKDHQYIFFDPNSFVPRLENIDGIVKSLEHVLRFSEGDEVYFTRGDDFLVHLQRRSIIAL